MNSDKNWALEVRSEIHREIRKFPQHDQKRILDVLGAMSENPYFGDIEKLEGQKNSWRRRVGAYRIFYEVRAAEKVIIVFRIKRRTSKTY